MHSHMYLYLCRYRYIYLLNLTFLLWNVGWIYMSGMLTAPCFSLSLSGDSAFANNATWWDRTPGYPVFCSHCNGSVTGDLMVPPSGTQLFKSLDSLFYIYIGLQKDFNQWDYLVEGNDKNLIPGPPSNVVSQSLALQHSSGLHPQN